MTQRGVTLVEIAIVLAIIAVLMGVVLLGTGMIGTSQSQAVQAAVKEVAEAMRQFRERYGYLPGDMPNATVRVPGVVAGSCSATANGNGDGQIDAGEVACVPNHLFNAGLIRGGAGMITLTQSGRVITIRAIARTASAVAGFPTSTRNVIEVLNLTCQAAQDLDNKTDDGNFAAGSTRGSAAACVVGGANDPMPTMAVAL